jgi:uncharacterized membrane protein YagU involved in acid resistance
MTLSPETKADRHLQLVLTGITGGVVGGIFFGFIMLIQGMFPTVAQLVRGNSVLIGITVHMAISILFGGLFGLLVERWKMTLFTSALLGLGYGVFWWVVGALILMPILLGATPQFSAALSMPALWSLAGHLMYGLATALTVAMMTLSRNLDFWG